ncbi:MAG: S41 family peptidase [Lachnospiraceae bacterium]|nr:S41 family peptidase [Lachnospiraceae bacterium]
MSRKFSLSAVLLIVAASVLLTFSVTHLTLNQKYNRRLNEIIADYNEYAKMSEISELIASYYIGETNGALLEEATIDGLISGLGDKYAVYYTAEEYKEKELESSGKLVGIGVQIIWNEESEALEVIDVLEGSPAKEAGLLPGDLIDSVGGEKVSTLGFEATGDRIRGSEGTQVTFSVIRDGARQIEFTVTRAAVASPSVYRHFYVDPDKGETKVGVIRITGFDSTTPVQFADAVETMKSAGAVGFVYDLRGNPGGELTSVTTILDALLPEGPIVRLTDKNGSETTYSSDADFLDIPCVVLVNGASASAAELFTSALRDYAKEGKVDAVVMGTKTYGKGTAQTLFRLKDNSAVSISTKKYDPPFSDNYEGIGITPDITVELSEEAASVNFYKLDDSTDNQLMEAARAIPAD